MHLIEPERLLLNSQTALFTPKMTVQDTGRIKLGYIFTGLSVTIISVFVPVHTKFLKCIFYLQHNHTGLSERRLNLKVFKITTRIRASFNNPLTHTHSFAWKDCNEVFIGMLKEIKLRTLAKTILPTNL